MGVHQVAAAENKGMKEVTNEDLKEHGLAGSETTEED